MGHGLMVKLMGQIIPKKKLLLLIGIGLLPDVPSIHQ
jgi:hypothetical protein